MKGLKCKANFISDYGVELPHPPDVYLSTGEASRPSPDFVISRSPDGAPISLYSDDTWDLRVYRLAGDAGAARVNFGFTKGSLKGEVKWLVFMLMFIARPALSDSISVATVMGYMKAVRAIARFSMEKDCALSEILSDKAVMEVFVATLRTRSALSSLSGVLTHLVSIPSEVSGYKVLGAVKHELVTNRLSKMGKDEQHPVIPPRIIASLIDQLDEFISDISSVRLRLESFLRNILEDKKFARSPSMQAKLGYRCAEFGPFFGEGADIYGLRALFERYGVRDLPSLSSFLTRTQHACRIYLHIYSGMRHSEALSLKLGCLKKKGRGRLSVFKLSGETSKFVGQKKPVSWVTSEDVLPAYKVVSTISSVVGNHIGLAKKETPLFISMGYLEFSCPLQHEDGIVRVASANSKSQEIYEYLDSSDLRITAEDLDLLEKISPLRAWEAESEFSVGTVWRFTTHQFRRSLAFYVAQSANVSLPSLKRQLKHLTRDMTVYYCQGSGLSKDFETDSHIASLFQREKPEADAVAYIYDAIMSAEKLSGAHGKHVERNVRSNYGSRVVLREGRDELISKFKIGQLAYTQTPLGACTTMSPCDKRLFRSIAACLNCDSAIIKSGKLDKVIQRQKAFIDDISRDGESTVELRTEREELEALVKFRDTMRSKEA